MQDRWPFGVLDLNDLLLQSWKGPPTRVTIADSGYAQAPIDIVRFKTELPRRDDGLGVSVEDSHAGSFFHGLHALRAGPATLVLLDQHSDASQNTRVAGPARRAWRP